MRSAIVAGAAYFLAMFALGSVLGTVRVLFVAPRLGGWGAIFVELPIMLLLSWFTCRYLLMQFAVPNRTAQRLVMGTVAFALLMIAEVILGTSLFDRKMSQQVQAMTAATGLAGLLGQLAFGTFPLLQLRRNNGA